MDRSAHSFVFEAIGTKWTIDVADPLTKSEAEDLLMRIKARIDTFDRAYSRFRADSLVTRLSQQAGVYELPEDAAPMIRLYEQLYQITSGLMTPLIGQVLIEAGYDAEYSLQPKDLHVPPSWDEVIRFEPPQTLTMKQAAMIDVGAMGKGYLIDIVSDMIWDRGLRSFCVEAGGDMLQRDPRQVSLRVGLEHPLDTAQVIGVVELRNKSLCGSAGNRRAWSTFHHIINPKTLTSPRDIVAIWAIAKTTMLADAMTTALFFVKPEVLVKYYSFEYAIMYADQTVKRSAAWPGELFGK